MVLQIIHLSDLLFQMSNRSDIFHGCFITTSHLHLAFKHGNITASDSSYSSSWETCAGKHQRQRGTPQVAAVNLQQVLDNTFTAMCRRRFSISMHKWWFSQQMFPIIAAFSAPCLRRRWLWLSRLRRRGRRTSLPEELMDSLSAAKRIWLQTLQM